METRQDYSTTRPFPAPYLRSRADTDISINYGAIAMFEPRKGDPEPNPQIILRLGLEIEGVWDELYLTAFD